MIASRALCLKITKNVAFEKSPKSPKSAFLGIFNELLATQNVNVARFARNVECDFFCDFHPLCTCVTNFSKPSLTEVEVAMEKMAAALPMMMIIMIIFDIHCVPINAVLKT